MRQQEALVDLSQRALTGIDSSKLLGEAVGTVTRILGADLTEAFALEGGKLRLEAALGGPDGLVGTIKLPVEGASQAAFALRHRDPVLTEDVAAEGRFAFAPHELDQGIRAGVSVLIGKPEAPWGVLGALFRRPRRFADDEVLFLRGVALTLSIGLSRLSAETALRTVEARSRRLVESNIMGVVIADTTGRILEGNDIFLATLGFTREDLRAGKVRWDELTPPEHRARTAKAFQEIRERGSCAPFEKEYFRKDGSRVPVFVGGASIPETKGEVVSFVLDLTAQKAVERKAREHEEWFRLLVNGVKDYAMYMLDPAGIVLNWNAAAERIIGYTEKGFIRLFRGSPH